MFRSFYYKNLQVSFGSDGEEVPFPAAVLLPGQRYRYLSLLHLGLGRKWQLTLKQLPVLLAPPLTRLALV